MLNITVILATYAFMGPGSIRYCPPKEKENSSAHFTMAEVGKLFSGLLVTVKLEGVGHIKSKFNLV